MALQVWTGGANDGVFMTAGNWSGGSAPANGETWIIGATNQNIHGAATGLTTTVGIITSGYGGIIGDDGNALTFASITSLTCAGRGASANFGCAGTAAAASLQHGQSQQVLITTGTWTALANGAGTVTIAAAAVVATLNNAAGPVSILYNATAITTLTSGGPTTCMRSITTANVKRSTLVQQDNGTTTYTAVTTANVENGAVYNKQSGGADGTWNVFPGGKFTIVGNSGGTTGVITNSTAANYWLGSTIIDVVPGIAQVTYSGSKTYVGGTLPQ